MTDDVARIALLLQPREILLGVDVRDRSHALEVVGAEIARLCGRDPLPITHMLTRREQAASTALGNGFAIPHARITGIAQPLTFYVRTKAPIAFNAPDGKPVSQLLVIMVPADGAKNEHLQLLALVAQLLSDRNFRDQLGGAADAAAAADVFRGAIGRLTTAEN